MRGSVSVPSSPRPERSASISHSGTRSTRCGGRRSLAHTSTRRTTAASEIKSAKSGSLRRERSGTDPVVSPRREQERPFVFFEHLCKVLCAGLDTARSRSQDNEGRIREKESSHSLEVRVSAIPPGRATALVFSPPRKPAPISPLQPDHNPQLPDRLTFRDLHKPVRATGVPHRLRVARTCPCFSLSLHRPSAHRCQRPGDRTHFPASQTRPA